MTKNVMLPPGDHVPQVQGRVNAGALGRARHSQGSAQRSSNPYDVDCVCCRLMAHKWTPQIVAVLLGGPRRFGELHEAVPGIGDKVLSRRLHELEAEGIVTREQYPEIPPRVVYALTPAGEALEPVIAEMDRWGREFF